jgi:hypothetical protein
VTLSLAGNKLINVVIDGATQDALGISNSGTIKANGGTVLLTARVASDILKNVVNNTGVIEARSLVNKAGQIILDGGDAGITANSGTLDVSSAVAGAKGGSLGIFGQYIGLYDGSKVNASGDAGGGTILIGGNFHGAGPEPNAYMTYVGSGATISADAITSGNGGKVAVWSDDATWFYGNISAKGGAQGGDGGYVETSVGASGQGILIAAGSVNAGAPAGKGGTWLLDPEDITISDNGGNSTGIGSSAGPPFQWYSNADGAVLAASTLSHSLTSGTTVEVETRVNGPTLESGNIYVEAPVTANLTAGQRAALDLDAVANISLTGTGSIAPGGGALNVNLNAGIDGTFTTPGTYASSITMAAGTSITTGGGNMTATAGGNAVNGIALAGINTGAGNLTVISNGGAITQNSAITVNGAASFTAGGNSIILSGFTNTFGGTVSLNTTGANNASVTANSLNFATSRIGGTLTAIAATGGITESGVITAGTLNVTNTLSATDFSSQANMITHLGTINASGQTFSIQNAQALDQTGTITADTLNVTTAGGLTLNNANAVSTLNATNTGSGNIAFTNTASPLTIVSISNTGGGSDTINNTGALTTTGAITTTGNGAISLTAMAGTETIGAAVTAGGSGAVTLATTGATSDILINANVGSTSGNIGATAGRNITLPNTSTDITTAGDVNLTAANNINGGSINGRTVTLNANTIGLAGQTNVNATGDFFGAITVNASGEQGGISAELYGSSAMFGRINPDPPGAVFYNGIPIDPATANIFAEIEELSGSTLSLSAEQMAAMARNAGFEAFFFMVRPPLVAAAETEKCGEPQEVGVGGAGGNKPGEQRPCEPGLTRIRVTEDGLLVIE